MACGCGAVLSIRARPGTMVTCPRCGRQVQAPWPRPPAAGPATAEVEASVPRLWMATASLVLGLLALLLGPGTGIVAIILGLVALERIRRSDGALGGERIALVGAGLGLAGSILCGVLTTTVMSAGFGATRRAGQRPRQIAGRPSITPPPQVQPPIPAPYVRPPQSPPPQPRARRPVAGPPITNSFGMKLGPIAPGNFLMGSPPGEAGRQDLEGPQRRVHLSKAFYIGITEVTQKQYEQVMNTNPSVAKGDDLPVGNVTYEEATEFCRRLTAAEREKGLLTGEEEYRLPTEAEWEYACRADSTTPWSCGDSAADLKDYAWFSENSGLESHAVGMKKPNAWGLYDMHGNAWERCLDWAGTYRGAPTQDPTGPATGTCRVLRGGASDASAFGVRSASRYLVAQPGRRSDNIGFRCVRTVGRGAVAAPQPPPASGLVAHYLMNGNAEDASGRGHHGQVNGPRPVADRFGRPNAALEFDGRDDYVQIPAHADFDGGPGLTVTMWLRQTRDQQLERVMAQGDFARGAHRFNFNLRDGGKPAAETVNGINWTTFGSGKPIPPNEWHQVVAVFDGARACVAFYLDGREVDRRENVDFPAAKNEPIIIGGEYHMGGRGNFFSGALDDVRFYAKVLSGSEVADLHQLESRRQ